MVFQDPAASLNPGLGAPRSRRAQTSRPLGAAERKEGEAVLEDRAGRRAGDRYPHELSGGLGRASTSPARW
jgi:ABC-type glutathione transport system ATPase component